MRIPFNSTQLNVLFDSNQRYSSNTSYVGKSVFETICFIFPSDKTKAALNKFFPLGSGFIAGPPIIAEVVLQ